MSFELALKEIERQTKMYKAFEEAHNALIALASLEQHTKELQKNKSVLESSLDKLNSTVKEKQERIATLEQKIKSAEKIVEFTLKEEETKRRQELEEQWTTLISKKQAELNVLEKQCAGFRDTSINYDTYIKAKQIEIDQLEKKITSAKEEIQRILNGNT